MQYPAIFYDGLVSRRRDVLVEFSRRTLRIFARDGEVLASWPARNVRRAQPVLRGGALRLRLKRRSTARLVVSDRDAMAAAMHELPQLSQITAGRRLTQTASTLAFVTALIVTTLYFAIPMLAKPIADTIPIELEDRIGRSSLRSLTGVWPACEGSGKAVIDGLAFRLANVEPTAHRIQIVVINSPMVNAFALPGGYVVVTGSLLRFMEGADELAGVLAHEIGHVKLRHPLEGMLSQLGVLLFVNLLTGGSGPGDIVGLGAEIATTSYTREYERQADIESLAILAAARIDPEAYARLFERFSDMEMRSAEEGDGLGLANLLRTHPYSEERAAAARALVVPEPVPALSDEQWATVQTLCGTPDDNGRVGRERP